ncbi:hypothetical protein [Photobacterium leiognathi]|uniref:hypothetical protein n=1 Tax=Photobacterium leiognathi TaxID=553611 RepID=UPI002739E366|nr:hypothetical protein [Photobacterium leiognathi]
MFCILDEIKRAYKNPSEKVWVHQEVTDLGQRYSGLDDLSSDCILDLLLLWSNDSALPHSDRIESLSEYELVKEDLSTGDYIITKKGRLAANEIIKVFIKRQLFESKRTHEHFERLNVSAS